MEELFHTHLTWEPEESSTRRHASRAHTLSFDGFGDLPGSSAPRFHGDRERLNPEQLLLAAVAQCHLLTYVYLAQRAGIEVASYRDHAEALLRVHEDGSGEITRITLHPAVIVFRQEDVERAQALHADVPALCFIERTVKTEVVVDAHTVGRPGIVNPE